MDDPTSFKNKPKDLSQIIGNPDEDKTKKLFNFQVDDEEEAEAIKRIKKQEEEK